MTKPRGVSLVRILITGGSGLIGAELARLWTRSGHEVLSGYKTHKPVFGKPVAIDLGDSPRIHALILKEKPELIVHTAAMSEVDSCEENPDLATGINGEATGKIAEAAKEIGSYMCYVSTDYVFDGKRGLYEEDDTPNPINHYGRSKLLGEALVKESGVQHCIARTSVIFGWGRAYRHNLGTWFLEKLGAGEQVEAVKYHFASPTLNLNFSEMLVEVVDQRLEGAIHLAGATRIDRCNFAIKLAETFDLDASLVKPVELETLNLRAKRPLDSSLSAEKATQLLGSKPLKLEEALKRFRAAQKKS